jgi:hypothetical protein
MLRDAMMYEDVDRYFEEAWMKGWTGWDSDSMALLAPKYGRPKIDELLHRYEIDDLGDEREEDSEPKEDSSDDFETP